MKKIISLVLAGMMLMSSAFAATAKEKLDATNKSIKDIQSQISSKESEQKKLMTEINNIEKTINATQRQISGIEQEIEELEDSIVIAEENIKYSEEQYNEKYELRKDRMVAYYKNGNVSFDELVNSIEDETDKLYMKRVIEKIVAYDTNAMNNLAEEKKELEEQKASLEADTNRCEALKVELQEKIADCEEQQEIHVQYKAALEADIDTLEAAEKDMLAEAKRLEAEIAAATKNSTNKYGGKMVFPLPMSGVVLTSPFGNRLHPVTHKYSLHTGVDLAAGGCNGKPVVAAADGTVIKATYSNSYGNYIIIDHGSGITTLYAHSSKLEVKVGDQVKAGQEIMKVGTTGWSTGPHLHFEVRENGTYVDPIGKGYIKLP